MNRNVNASAKSKELQLGTFKLYLFLIQLHKKTFVLENYYFAKLILIKNAI